MTEEVPDRTRGRDSEMTREKRSYGTEREEGRYPE